jgi:hypothetical protein
MCVVIVQFFCAVCIDQFRVSRLYLRRVVTMVHRARGGWGGGEEFSLRLTRIAYITRTAV